MKKVLLAFALITLYSCTQQSLIPNKYNYYCTFYNIVGTDTFKEGGRKFENQTISADSMENWHNLYSEYEITICK